MLRIITFVCAVAFAAAQCGQSRFAAQPDKLIVGGEAATKGAWPWQISLENYGSHICGGSIIDATTVITAAHCVSGGKARNYKVLAGEHDRTTVENEEQRVRVASIQIHSRYNSRTMANDIAILFLREPLVFNAFVSPVCLPETSAGDFNDALATVTGWGETESAQESNKVLREVVVPVMTNDECNQKYQGEIDNTMICAGYEQGGKDSCQGDSGGPMVTEVSGSWHLIGVVSWGYGCADAGNPGVYARVTTLRSWINGQRSRYHKNQLNKIGDSGKPGKGNGKGNAFGKGKNWKGF